MKLLKCSATFTIPFKNAEFICPGMQLLNERKRLKKYQKKAGEQRKIGENYTGARLKEKIKF